MEGRESGSLVTIRFSSLSLAASGPVVAAGQQCCPVEIANLWCMWNGSGPPASGCPTVRIVAVRTLVLRLGVIGDDPHSDRSAMRIEDGVGDAVVGDGKHTDVGGPARVRQEPRDRSRQSSPGLKTLRHSRTVGGLDNLQGPRDLLDQTKMGRSSG